MEIKVTYEEGPITVTISGSEGSTVRSELIEFIEILDQHAEMEEDVPDTEETNPTTAYEKRGSDLLDGDIEVSSSGKISSSGEKLSGEESDSQISLEPQHWDGEPMRPALCSVYETNIGLSPRIIVCQDNDTPIIRFEALKKENAVLGEGIQRQQTLAATALVDIWRTIYDADSVFVDDLQRALRASGFDPLSSDEITSLPDDSALLLRQNRGNISITEIGRDIAQEVIQDIAAADTKPLSSPSSDS